MYINKYVLGVWKDVKISMEKTKILIGTVRTVNDVLSRSTPFYTQFPLIRTTAKLPTLGVLKNSSNLDAHWFLIPQV